MSDLTPNRPGIPHLVLPSDTRAIAVWLVLTAATCLSWWLGADHGLSEQRSLASTIILLIAFAKVRLIGLHFMDLRQAPRSLSGLFDVVCLAIFVLLLVMYFVR